MICITRRMERSRLRLEPYYEDLILPEFHIDADPETVRQYRLMFRPWAASTGDPAIGDITSATLAQHVRWLLGKELARPPAANRQLSLFEAQALPGLPVNRRPMAPATANKVRRQLLHLLAKAGPADARNRDALGILAKVPWVKPLKEAKPKPRVTSDDELSRIYLAFAEERLPCLDGILAADWWRALLVAALTTDCRREALFGLEWPDVDFAAMTIRVAETNDKENCERKKPMAPILAGHLLKIRGFSARVFPWPHGQRTWYERWHAVQTRAGIHARAKSNRGEHYTLHEQKGTGLTRLAKIASPEVVQFMGDHATAAMARHYIPLEETPAIRAAVNTLRLPDVFYGPPPPAAASGAG